MPYTATVTVNNVVLPDQNLHQAGDVITLTDDAYAQMGPTLRAAVLTGIAQVGGTKSWQFDMLAMGAKGDDSTDDTAACQAAIDEADAYATANGYAEILVPQPPVAYLLDGPLVQSRHGNSLLTMPVHDPSTGTPKINLAFKGGMQSASLPHWLQTQKQINPSLFHCPNSFAYDGVHGEPAILGGPNFNGGYGSGLDVFSNVCVTMDGISFMGPNVQNAGISGADFVGIAELEVGSGSYLVDRAPSGGILHGGGSGYAFGIRTPNNGNNDLSLIRSWSTESLTYGMMLGEHTTVLASRVVYCYDGYAVVGSYGGVGAQHAVNLLHASAEACVNHLVMVGNGARVHALLDIEDTNVSIVDQSSATPATGDIWLTGAFSTVSLPASTSQVKIHNTMQNTGAWSGAPALAASGTDLQNASGRDATVIITGGTVTAIAVDGVATGLTSGAIPVPSGKNLKVTYSVAPTVKWVLQ